MCKFFIMGICTKGDGCRFAHEKTQLQTLPDLSCTKLCKTLIATGVCNNADCRYAHNKEQLRGMPDPSTKLPLSSLDGVSNRQSGSSQQTAHAMQGPAVGSLAQAAGGGASLMTGTGPCGMVIGQPMPQGAVQGQGPFNASLVQAAIVQIGQVAQAHAAEAARLQAMAATFNDGSQHQQMPAASPQFFIPVAMPMAYTAPPGQALPGAPSRGAAGGHGGGAVAAKPRSLVQIAPCIEESTCSSGAPGPHSDSGYGRTVSGATGSTAAGSQEVDVDVADEGGGPRVSTGCAAQGYNFGGDHGMSDMTVKNTFLDFDVAPSAGALRSVQTAAGRLDHLACPSVDQLDSLDA
jgi:hypothetical protein